MGFLAIQDLVVLADVKDIEISAGSCVCDLSLIVDVPAGTKSHKKVPLDLFSLGR